MAAYPETTDYIIDTMLRFGRLANDQDCCDCGRRVTDWEVALQLGDGGIRGGTIGAQRMASSTFVTGQVIFGWVRAFQAFTCREFAVTAP